MTPELDYRAIRQRVDEKTKKEIRLVKFVLFAVNLGVFVLFFFIAWQTYLGNGGEPPRWEDFVNIPGIARPAGNPATSALVMLTMGWIVALIIQIVSLIFDTQLGESQTRERIMGREVNKEIARLGLDTDEQKEKAKRIMRLTDDGELENIEEEETTYEPERKQHNRRHE